jgi:hypothetical protein
MPSEAMITQNIIETPKSAVGVFELPCGYLTPEGQILTEVVVREMTGGEEDMLASKQVPPAKKFGELIARCVTRIGTVTDKGEIAKMAKQLTLGDRVFLLFVIRRVTLGDEYPFREVCPNGECKQAQVYTVDLSELTVKKMPEPTKRIYDVTLPSGRKARFRVSTGEDEEKIQKNEKSPDAMSLGILMRLEMLDGKPPTLQELKDMGWKDRVALRDEWNKVEGGVDTEVELGCPVCGHEFKRELEVSGGFFFPSAISPN